METYIAYFDETGDDGLINTSSEDFVLTSIYTKTENWQKNYNAMKNCRALLKEKYGFHSTVEMHTKHFLTDKNPYRNYGWTKEQKQEILKTYTKCIAEQTVIDEQFITRVLVTLRYYGRLNLNASKENDFGLVIYPK